MDSKEIQIARDNFFKAKKPDISNKFNSINFNHRDLNLDAKDLKQDQGGIEHEIDL